MEQSAPESVQRQIIIHKSNWGSQVIKVLVFLIIVGIFYKKNPSSYDLQKHLIKEYCEKQGVQQPICKVISENSPDLLSSFIDRTDLVFFSHYDFRYNSGDTTVNLKFIGVLNTFISLDEESSNDNPVLKPSGGEPPPEPPVGDPFKEKSGGEPPKDSTNRPILNW